MLSERKSAVLGSRVMTPKIYEGPNIDEEHNDQDLSTADIDAMQKKEVKFQKAKKKRMREEKDGTKRKRAILRINKI